MVENKDHVKLSVSAPSSINLNKAPHKQAFIIPFITQYLKREVVGKRVLDIGCGNGDWSYHAAVSGARSVDGFDIQEDMVRSSKQATSQFTSVNIRIGDVRNMPYGDNCFDFAMSLFITCMLPPDACIGHFNELHRVLVPGGKAIVINFSKPAFESFYISKEADRLAVEKEIDKKLASLSSNPQYEEIASTFNGMKEVLLATFAINENGRLFRVTDEGQLTNGQGIWIKSSIMVHTNHFYDDKYFQDQTKASGLCIDQIENFYTEERRIAYNSANPHNEIDKECIEHPPFLLYHLSKP